MIQAKDISEESFLAEVDLFCKENPSYCGAIYWQMAKKMGVPKKVILAKAKSLIRRGIIDGCACGCRGDFRRPGSL